MNLRLYLVRGRRNGNAPEIGDPSNEVAIEGRRRFDSVNAGMPVIAIDTPAFCYFEGYCFNLNFPCISIF